DRRTARERAGRSRTPGVSAEAHMPSSYRSAKTVVAKSAIHGCGLFARRTIRKGEIVAIKGGHVLDARTLARVKNTIAWSYIQIDDDFYLGAVKRSEVGRNKIWTNHSCEPNVGIRGQGTFVTMRNVKAGEELTYDWAMEENRRAITHCKCGRTACRGVLTGEDWRKPELQRRYDGFFSAYLAEKFRHRRARGRGRR